MLLGCAQVATGMSRNRVCQWVVNGVPASVRVLWNIHWKWKHTHDHWFIVTPYPVLIWSQHQEGSTPCWLLLGSVPSLRLHSCAPETSGSPNVPYFLKSEKLPWWTNHLLTELQSWLSSPIPRHEVQNGGGGMIGKRWQHLGFSYHRKWPIRSCWRWLCSC